MKVEVDVLGSPSLTVYTVSVDINQHLKKRKKTQIRGQELCESRGGCPGLPIRNSMYSLCGRKATLEEEEDTSQSSGAV